MKSEKFFRIYTFILALICILLFYEIYNIYNENKQIISEQEILSSKYDLILSNQKSFKIYYEHTYQVESKLNSSGINGLYYSSDDYYCVWTKDRIQSDIQKTDYHESCHALIDSELHNHFCGEVAQ